MVGRYISGRKSDQFVFFGQGECRILSISRPIIQGAQPSTSAIETPPESPRVAALQMHRIRMVIDGTRASGKPMMRTIGREPYPARIVHSPCPRRRRRDQLQVRWIAAALFYERGKFMSEYQSQLSNLHLLSPTLPTPPTPRTPSHPKLRTDGLAHIP
jgi:hypothetical protein